ncbi:MAG TPA: aminotransferase class III-fold pyridoxal phosphate-dependent enzyme, partial [Candidatus Acidoferrum sp.]|nr:aminotransferase class III-fold pyridoxal phosphate-dependent enzyme [Candidatus Acidoferrum sp.]
GEGGYVVPPAAFMRGLRELCDRHGILLIADEIQSGMGRTGRWFAMEHFGITPDIMTVAKGLGSGLPIAGVISRLDLMKRWVPGSHGGTFGGNAVAAAAGVATIAAIQEENLLENARARGEQLAAGLRRLQKQAPSIGDVRAIGLMVGVEFRSPDRKPDKAAAKAAAHACLDSGLMLLTCGPWDNTVRWIPPLVVTSDQIDQALDIFGESL